MWGRFADLPDPGPRPVHELHDELGEEGIHVPQLIIAGQVVAGDPVKGPDVLAGHLWDLHTSRDRFRLVVGS